MSKVTNIYSVVHEGKPGTGIDTRRSNALTTQDGPWWLATFAPALLMVKGFTYESSALRAIADMLRADADKLEELAASREAKEQQP